VSLTTTAKIIDHFSHDGIKVSPIMRGSGVEIMEQDLRGLLIECLDGITNATTGVEQAVKKMENDIARNELLLVEMEREIARLVKEK
jgi:hypothetical protein